MAESLPLDQLLSKRLDTASAAEYASMVVNLRCITEAITAFRLCYDRWRKGEPDSDEETAIRAALYRDGLTQVMACFTTNPQKRHEHLIPSEAFAGLDGWEKFYQYMHDLRDAYAAHNFGTKRMVEPVVIVHPNTGEVLGLGHLAAHFVGEGLDGEKGVMTFCQAAQNHVTARIAQIETELLKELKAIPPDELLGLPDAQLRIAGTEDIKTGREKFRKKSAGAEPANGGQNDPSRERS